jgi:hypothetical protein
VGDGVAVGVFVGFQLSFFALRIELLCLFVVVLLS